MDTQQIEILGRNRLVNELIAAGLEVAVPLRDRGVDLLAYIDLSCQSEHFTSVLIQMKSASAQYFGVQKKYGRFANIILAFVWNLNDQDNAVTYAMSYADAVHIAEEMGWTKTASWEKSGYSTSNPSKKLLEMLDRHRMNPSIWKALVSGKSEG